jgi:hypothetical protein
MNSSTIWTGVIVVQPWSLHIVNILVFIESDEAVEIGLGFVEVFKAVLLTPSGYILDYVPFTEADVAIEAEGDDITVAGIGVMEEVAFLTSSFDFRGDRGHAFHPFPFRRCMTYGGQTVITNRVLK